MREDKIILTKGMRDHLRKLRNEKEIIVEDLSERIGKSKGWLAQIENGRLATIKEDDLNKILNILDYSMCEFKTYFDNDLEEDSPDTKDDSFTKTLYKILRKQYPDASKIEISVTENKISVIPYYEEKI